MVLKWFTVVSWVASAAGLGIFGYSMTQQTNIQMQMNRTMAQMNQSIHDTTPLVAATSKALEPLAATTSALSQIEIQEQHTVSDLAAMNTRLKTIGDSEGQVLAGMNSMLTETTAVGQEIGTVSNTTGGVLHASSSSAVSAQAEANDLAALNQHTADVIAQLHKLNTKLSALKLLP
ncbi:hypothetical protein [Alicyclobacillus dauci]|uniref:Methyl-accepting chemotaxis protein n=1 Tax=Alicyclobacillus dauci TaxID=1475485 RepID=A0ABY6Z065_9BACL|nr:hypothetical protein [Alicyclobacillus dauci]WAH36145.1 hypothetical protein NZD86_18125 [Alicyclobacillus dauci]